MNKTLLALFTSITLTGCDVVSDVSADIPTADIESPFVSIEAPTSTLGQPEKVKVTYTDSKGLFRVYSDASGSGISNPFLSSSSSTLVSEVLYESEISVVRESSIIVPFGGESVIHAYAIDLAGNATTATSTINSIVGISTGQYKLDPPLNETISGSGCQLENSDRLLKAETINVSGRFKPDLGEKCANYNMNEIENAVACISVSLQEQEYSGFGGTVGALTSIEDTEYSANSGGSSGSGAGDSYNSYTQMHVQFFDTTPATVAIDMTLTCESTQYGTTSFGPYQLYGSLVE